MVINPPLLFVSGLFFLALASALYIVVYLLATVTLWIGRGRFSHARAKQVLLTSLFLPPLLAAVPTLSGATLRHSHARPLLEHHSLACSQLFSSLSAAWSGGASETSSHLMGYFVNGLAWLLVTLGLVYLVRLVIATLQLERGLVPYLSLPSARLARAVAHVGRRSKTNGAQFFECPIPAAYSSVLGLRHTRCILSQELVAAATTEELNAIVAHESTHLRLRDVETTFLVSILNCLFFYLRPVRLLARRWREETELACDTAAVQVVGDPLAMATAILRVSGAPARANLSGLLPTVALAFADESACLTAKRVENLIAQAQRSALPAVRETWLHSVGGWVVTLALAGIGVSLLLSPQAVCYAHCSLEAAAHLLP